MSIGVTDMEKAGHDLESLPSGMLELLERQTTAFLYALWKAQGKNKRIVKPQDKRPLPHVTNEGDG